MNAKHSAAEEKNDKKSSRHGIKDLRARIICFLFAILLWFYVVSSQTIIDEREFKAVPVKIEQANSLYDEENHKMTVIEGLDYKVDILVTGTLGELNRLDYDDIIAYVDLSGINTAGEKTLEVKTRVPGGVDVKELSTGTVTVYVDRMHTATFDIDVEPDGWSLEEGYNIGEATSEPKTVTVTGPLGVLSEIKSGKVKVNCGHLTNTIEIKGSVYLVDENGEPVDNRYLEYNSDVNVKIPVIQSKEVALDVAFKYGYHNKNTMPYTITPKTITVKGDPNDIKRIEDPFILTVIDEKELTGKDKYILPSIEFDLPEDVEVINASSAVVEINLSNLSTKEITVPITVKNDKNLSYRILETEKTVTFRGSRGSLAMLTADNVQLNVDISNFNKGSGLDYVPIEVEIYDELTGSVYEVGSYSVQIEIY